ncbi:MAG TPA: N-acyl homoserine lactonase family protein [Sphingomonadaceae bacterium]|nr:N-acyl homoserine lactonase family protein [Sphingomonadaceae bacterium]
MKKVLAAAAAFLTLTGMQAAPRRAPAPDMALWRLDCGTIQVSDLDVFSDTYLYRGQKKTLTNSCYLVKHGASYLLWDTGLPGSAMTPAPAQGPFAMRLTVRIADQLARIGVRPDQVNFVGISHSHGDHTGQAIDFPRATLLMGPADYETVSKGPDAQARFGPWVSGAAKFVSVPRDRDVFGDGRVVMLDMPGHTPGHKSLLVDLPGGAVLLTGDLYHFTQQVANNGVPSFNADRSDTLGSFDRFRAIAKNRRAKVIIQHEPGDVAKLPAFPKAAR